MQLPGTWRCTSATIDGNPLAAEKAAALRLTLTDHRLTTVLGEQVLFDSTYTVDATQQPATIDMLGTEGESQGKPGLGIYRLDGDTLTLCYCLPGNPRPAAFESPPKCGIYLVVWKREEN
jgi:uncharacterized protein (TIGR03067 family)